MSKSNVKEKKANLISFINSLDTELKNVRSIIFNIKKNLTQEESKLIELKIKKERAEQELISLENFL